MKSRKKQLNIFNKAYVSIMLLIMVFISPLSMKAVDKVIDKNIKIAKKIKTTKQNAYAESKLDINFEEKLPYTFNISDKLVGSGEVDLSIDGNKIKGSAIGIGKTGPYDVDLTTDINGLFRNLDYINVKVSGIGDPKGLIPGKIGFSGPLKGEVINGKISLAGSVKIEGKLAKLGGFNEVEKVVIEIPATALIQAYREKTKEQNIALSH